MKSIGIVICNYNGKDFLTRCISTVLESTISDYDIYVVDNASIDGSAEKVQELFKDKVTLIRNKENLGGSGGFNAGIRKALERNYDYICCLDNDVQLDENALKEMRDFLQQNDMVGMVGAKVYHAQNPDYVQQFGLRIDMEHTQITTCYADTLETGTLPEVVYCESVAACVVMLPSRVIREVGLLPEENFIYWDDTEWGYRVKLAGYQVAAIGSALALHEMSAATKKKDTFTTYYMYRNKMYFYMKFTPVEDWNVMSVTLLKEVFYDMYEAIYKGEHNTAKTILGAFRDAMNGIKGKAEEGRIRVSDEEDTRLVDLIDNDTMIFVENETDLFLKRIHNIKDGITITEKREKADVLVQCCDDIWNLINAEQGAVYVDNTMNVATTEVDMKMINNREFCLSFFLYFYQEIFLSATKRENKLLDILEK